MIQIFHNPKCSKSREGLQLLNESGKEFEVVEYMKTPISAEELKSLIEKLKIKPIELIRKNEAIWKQNYKNKTLSDEQIIDAMLEHLNLIERPIVVNGNKAVIGRPPVLIKDIL